MIGREELFKIMLLGMFVVSTIVNASATNYFVENSTEFNALSLSSGDVVVLKNGVWENAALQFKGIGTESNPITLRAETGGEVFLTGSSSLKMGGQYLIVDGLVFIQGSIASGGVVEFRTSSSNFAYNSRLTNTKIYYYNPASIDTEYKWVSLYGQNNRVDHCHFEGKTHSGALLVVWLDDQPNYHTIDSNYFGQRPNLGYNGGEIIRIGTSDWSMYDSYSIVEQNLFENCDGEIEIISNKSCNNIYRNNTFRTCAGSLTLRHGNDCEVYNNFFFGVSSKDCGGIRIIGENHKVYNNYLQDIPSDGYRSAICLVNGVPDSPLYRYFQVKNAEVVNNTLVNCEHPIIIGAGSDSEKSLPPEDCLFANNVVAIYSGSVSRIIEYEDTPTNLQYEKNIMYGATLGITVDSGISTIDPLLEYTDFWRPSSTSDVLGAGSSSYSYVSFDIDGQARVVVNDAGCDQQSSDAISNKPLVKSDVGVIWNSIKEVSAAEGGSRLIELIDSANDGDVIVLTSSGGIYEISESSQLTKDIKIRAEIGLEEKPVVKVLGQVNEFISLLENSNVQLEGIEVDGSGDSFNNLGNILKVYSESYLNDTHSISINDCFFHDLNESNSGSVVAVSDGAIISNFDITNTQIFDVGKEFVFFDSLAYAIDLSLTNCSFINVGNEVLKMNCEAVGLSVVEINHCTIDSVGLDGSGSSVFELDNADVSIENSIFSNCRTDVSSFEISGENSSIDYCMFWKSAGANTSGSASLGDSLWIGYDPLFASRTFKEYTLLPNSPALNRSNDNYNLGDLYWEISNGHLSNNALLSDLQVDNIPIDSFDPYLFEYNSGLENVNAYILTGIPQDDNAIINVDYPVEIPGEAYIEVMAENSINKSSYKLSLAEFSTIESIQNNDELLKVFPNPSYGTITIQSGLSGMIFIYNSLGKLVKNVEFISPEVKINLSELPTGNYELILQSTSQKQRLAIYLIK